MPESMVERVARAICIATGNEPETWAAQPHFRDMCRKTARAAIEAMREPTDAMVRTGSANIAPWWSQAMRNSPDYANTKKAAQSAFSGMIDAALNESSQ